MLNKLIEFLLKIGLKVNFGKLTPYLKLLSSYIRYYITIYSSPISKKKEVYFIASLPKSGSTWLENIIAELTKSTLIMPVEPSHWERANGRSDDFIPKIDFIKKLPNKRWVVKLHSKCSIELVRILKNNNLRPIILYRDISQIIESHYFYVKNTKFHFDYKFTINQNENESIEFLRKKYEQDYKDWLEQWQKNPEAIIISYNDLLKNPIKTISHIAKELKLDYTKSLIEDVINNNTLQKMKKRSAHKAFFRGSHLKKNI